MLIRDGANRFDSSVRGDREKSEFCFFSYYAARGIIVIRRYFEVLLSRDETDRDTQGRDRNCVGGELGMAGL